MLGRGSDDRVRQVNAVGFVEMPHQGAGALCDLSADWQAHQPLA